MSTYSILAWQSYCMIGGFLVVLILKQNRVDFLLGSLKTLFVLVGTLYTLTPVLITLTNSISDDTIASTVFLLVCVHLLSFDYSQFNEKGDNSTLKKSSTFSSLISLVIHVLKNRLQPAISINCAMCAALLLGSRLRSHTQLFALIFLAIEIFILLPMIFSSTKVTTHSFFSFLSAHQIILTLPFQTFYFREISSGRKQ